MDIRAGIFAFLRSRVGTLGVSSLVLLVLEKLMDLDFVCPCQPGYNEVICACYAIVPFVTCFAFAFRFVAPKPEDRGNSTCNKVLYSLLIACIWLFLFFVDGRYVSCACSNWSGEYTETGALKWCKHNESEAVVLENEQKTERCITGSQVSSHLYTQQRLNTHNFIILCQPCKNSFWQYWVKYYAKKFNFTYNQ